MKCEDKRDWRISRINKLTFNYLDGIGIAWTFTNAGVLGQEQQVLELWKIRSLMKHLEFVNYTIEQWEKLYQWTEEEQFSLEVTHFIVSHYLLLLEANEGALSHKSVPRTGMTYYQSTWEFVWARDPGNRKKISLAFETCLKTYKGEELFNCYQNTKKLHSISKDEACLGEDGHHALYVEASMEKRNVLVDNYFKADGKLYYPLKASHISKAPSCVDDDYVLYLYEYDCASKKPKQIVKNPFDEKLSQCDFFVYGYHQWEVLGLVHPFEWGAWWDVSYFLFSVADGTKKYLNIEGSVVTDSVDVKSFIWLDWFNQGVLNHISPHLYGYDALRSVSFIGWIELVDLNKDFVGTLRHIFPIYNESQEVSYYISEAKIDLLKRKIGPQ